MFEYYTIGIIALLAAVSPGPDLAIVLRNAIGHHQRAGIFTALGISAGILVHTSYCLLGLALVISQSILLFNIIKFAGASYIIYLGVSGLLAKKPTALSFKAKKLSSISNHRAFLNGFITNLLNQNSHCLCCRFLH
jgi:threonine/homoserine/homoserine lactone efflux protein